MNKDLKTEMEEIVNTLKSSKKVNLAKQISENWNKSCIEYSTVLNSYKTAHPLESIFKNAIIVELERLGYGENETEEIVEYLKTHRIIETTPHISPGQKPRYFFINWLASLSLEKRDFFPVAMFSGVPFSNKTRPGRICSKEGDINLISSNMQDTLVYRSKIGEKMIEEIGKLPDNIKKILPEAKLGESYTKWALKSSQEIESRFLKGQPIFFDFNEVASNYILLAIEEKNNPIYKIFFTKENIEAMSRLFSKEVFFYGTKKESKYEEMEVFYLKNGFLEGSSRTITLTPENLKKEIEDGLCPGLPLGFLIFTFLNHFKCFGSFAQTEYLPMYKDDFMKIPCLSEYDIKNSPVENLTTTGNFPFLPEIYPFDLYLDPSVDLEKSKEMLWGETILAIKDILLNQNYSSNMIK